MLFPITGTCMFKTAFPPGQNNNRILSAFYWSSHDLVPDYRSQFPGSKKREKMFNNLSVKNSKLYKIKIVSISFSIYKNVLCTCMYKYNIHETKHYQLNLNKAVCSFYLRYTELLISIHVHVHYISPSVGFNSRWPIGHQI